MVFGEKILSDIVHHATILESPLSLWDKSGPLLTESSKASFQVLQEDTPEKMADIERGNQHTDILQVQIKQEDGEEPHNTEDRLKSSNTGEQKPCHICPDCGKSYTRSDNLKTHQKIHMTERPYLCSECGKGFTRTDHLKSHLKTHERKKKKLKHPCTDCVKGFVHLEQLEKHLEKNHLTHKEKKPHSCPRCDESFSDLEELTTHLPVHTEELALYCSDCGKRFLHKGKFERHQRVHSGQMPYICTHCGEGFTQAHSLKHHQRIHTGEKPYLCNECGESFRHDATYRRHKRKHELPPSEKKTYPCSVCGKTFTRSDGVMRHLRRFHYGERALQCSCCDKRFFQQDTLTTHMRIHTGEKPYSCSDCGRSFSQDGDRKKHQKRHHAGEGIMDPEDTIVTEPKDIMESEDRIVMEPYRIVMEPEDRIGTEPEDRIGTELEDRVFIDPEGSDAEEPDGILIEPEDPEAQQEEDDDEEDDNIFATWMGRYKKAAEQEDQDKGAEKREAVIEERKNSFERQTGPRAARRQSLPCPAQLTAMIQLSRPHSAVRAPSPARPNSRQCISSTEDPGCPKPANTERRSSMISELEGLPKIKMQARFRRRNVMSLSDADRVCLICHDDLQRGSGIRELHCSHSFHIDCIEEWLWRKQACPTCRVQVALSPEPLYWSSTQVKVP